MREHCAAHLAAYEVPEYVVFASALPTNAAGKTLKPPLVDFWGDGFDGAEARLAAYCASHARGAAGQAAVQAGW